MEEGASASSNRDKHFRWGLPQVGTRDQGSSNGSRLERDEQWIWRKEIGLDSIVLALPENLGTSHQYRTSPQDAEVHVSPPWNPAQAFSAHSGTFYSFLATIPNIRSTHVYILGHASITVVWIFLEPLFIDQSLGPVSIRCCCVWDPRTR